MNSKKLEKLNVKIAKKLGWKKFRKAHLPEPLQKEKRHTGIAPGNWRHQFVPNYLGNLAYAMKCVDWANLHGYEFSLHKGAAGGASYEAFFNQQFNIKRYVGRGTLPSVAICMAFLNIK